MAVSINIFWGYPDETLKLTNNGHSSANKGNKIIWKIKDQSHHTHIKVDSIEIEIVEDPDQIISRVYQEEGKWKADISFDAPDYKECKYTIHWKDPSGKLYHHDPKISIRPSGGPLLLKILIGFILAFVGFFTLGKLRKKSSIK